MINTCSHSQDELVLHFHGELDAQLAAVISARLLICESCRESFETLEALSLVVPRRPTVVLEEDTLAAIRSATSARLSAVNRNKQSYSLIPGLRRSTQWGFVTAMVFLAFIVGRSSFQPQSLTQALPLDPPSRISAIDYDAAQGMVQIQYEQSSLGQVRGAVHDSKVQTLLGSAILDEDNPAGRLRAAQILSESNFLELLPDHELTNAFQSVLETEKNPGIRLQIIKALKSLFVQIPLTSSLKEQLYTLLINDTNTAVRLEVLDLLTQNERASIEMRTILELAQGDMNPLIRRKAQEALDGLQETGPLEEVK